MLPSKWLFIPLLLMFVMPLAGAGTTNPAVEALLDTAVRLVENTQYNEAASTLERALRISPKDAEIWHLLGQVRLHQGQHSQAQAMAEKSSTLAGKNSSLKQRNRQIIQIAQQLSDQKVPVATAVATLPQEESLPNKEESIIAPEPLVVPDQPTQKKSTVTIVDASKPRKNKTIKEPELLDETETQIASTQPRNRYRHQPPKPLALTSSPSHYNESEYDDSYEHEVHLIYDPGADSVVDNEHYYDHEPEFVHRTEPETLEFPHATVDFKRLLNGIQNNRPKEIARAIKIKRLQKKYKSPKYKKQKKQKKHRKKYTTHARY